MEMRKYQMIVSKQKWALSLLGAGLLWVVSTTTSFAASSQTFSIVALKEMITSYVAPNSDASSEGSGKKVATNQILVKEKENPWVSLIQVNSRGVVVKVGF